ncbi:hypothetical protein C7N43_16530 [Sphingobacteriales bacterium UPWRP_1]|nr:hypothetical protein B6N25_02520 [Sphingobacteriales bacterium TSM_CSS]PSJ75936.1 hypothetical protein C7N43_16530 [Sphingobacteriales bacterium UPWRP_1]
MHLHRFVTVILLFSCGMTQAQSAYLPLQMPAYHLLDRVEIKSGTLDTNYIFTSAKPYIRFNAVLLAESTDNMDGVRFSPTDRYNQYYIYKDNNEWSYWGLIPSKKPFLKHFYKYPADFLRLKYYDELLLKASPVLHMQLGKEQGVKGIRYINTRGAEIRGMINEQIGFYTLLTDNQVSYPDYAQQFTQTYNAVPGEGRVKDFNSMLGDSIFAPGHDFFHVRGYVTFQPVERVRLQFGHDKNFIGNGVRSLFLSDFSNNYLFLKINTQVWRLNYQNLFMQLTGQFKNNADGALPRKYAAMHHLSLNVTKRLNLGLFESVIYGRENGGFELSYLNPIIFYRAVEYHLGSPDNVLLGMDVKYNFLKHFSFYGQFLLDEFKFGEIKDQTGWWGNKYGLQAGLKYIDVAGVSNLDAQIEFNTVRPYTYTHNTESGNYTHFNQPLAHPLGANFRETLAVLRYKPHKKVDVKLNLLYAQYGADTDSVNWGGNIFLLNTTRPQEYNNHLLQGNRTNIVLADFLLSYMWRHNFWFDFTYTYRRQKAENPAQTNTDQLFGLGIRLNMARKELLF